MSPDELKDYVADQLQVPVTEVEKLVNSFNKVIDFITSEVADVMPLWTAGQTFQTDGTNDGKYCKHPDLNGKLRLFETKTDDNIGNEPPTDPGTDETAHWKVVSPSESRSIPEWAPGVYPAGLVQVFHNHSTNGDGIYKLVEPTRPFTSINIEAEIAAGQWKCITSKWQGKWNYAANADADPPWSAGDYGESEGGRGEAGIDDNFVPDGVLIIKTSTRFIYL